MICKKCEVGLKQLKNSDVKFCPNCDSVDVPVDKQEQIQASGPETDFRCPKCPDINLQIGDLFGTQVCFCDECYGFVIDRTSLGQLIEGLRASYEGPDDAPIQIDPAELHEICNCPACLERMETFNYYGPGNVILDSCEHCQLTWFNQGELGKIIRAPGVRKLRKSVNGESEFLRERLYAQAEAERASGIKWLLQTRLLR